MGANNNTAALRKVASILLGKLETDVTMDELKIARKAHGMFLNGSAVADIRVALKLPAVSLSPQQRARMLDEQNRAVSYNRGSRDCIVARSSDALRASHLNKGQ